MSSIPLTRTIANETPATAKGYDVPTAILDGNAPTLTAIAVSILVPTKERNATDGAKTNVFISSFRFKTMPIQSLITHINKGIFKYYSITAVKFL